MDLGGMGGVAVGMMYTWGFWVILVVMLVGISFGSLYMRKQGKYHFPAIIFTDNGNGKMGLKYTKAGWFKSQKILGGLIEIGGEKRMEVKDGRIVQQMSGKDLHEIKFKAGLLVQEKHDDPKILVPINKMFLDEESRKMLIQIAPADYRDACSKILSDTKKELSNKWETLAQVLVFGLVAIILFISIILVIQYSKNAMSEANAIHKEALGFYESVLNRMGSVPSTDAP